MERERDEVYERIPWETLQQKGSERNWVIYVVAGAISLGALGYSFMRGQPSPPAPISEAAVEAQAGDATAAPAITTPVSPAPPLSQSPPAVSSPVVVAEADLYAVDQVVMEQKAAAHAEWFAVEFMALDGGDASERTLAALLPEGAPMPDAEPGTQVFVDWAGVQEVHPIDPTGFMVEVLVRSLVSAAEGSFSRQPPTLVSVPIQIGPDGSPMVAGVPSLSQPTPTQTAAMDLQEVPVEISTSLDPGDEVVGGRQMPDGTWEVVVLRVGVDGVRRPITIRP